MRISLRNVLHQVQLAEMRVLMTDWEHLWRRRAHQSLHLHL